MHTGLSCHIDWVGLPVLVTATIICRVKMNYDTAVYTVSYVMLTTIRLAGVPYDKSLRPA